MSIYRILTMTSVLYLLGKCAHTDISGSEIGQIVMNDMRNAFRIITDDARMLNSIIYDLYNLSSRIGDSAIIFKIPKQGGTSNLEVLRRNLFVDPIFPNITDQRQWQMRREMPFGAIQRNSNVSSEELIGEGSRAALEPDGWIGETESHSRRPSNFGSSRAELQLGEKSDYFIANVYIARANDPFGYSTQWPQRYSYKRAREHRTSKRDVANLYSMIKCSTGCDPLAYKGYGCYCGFLGAGVAVDGIDTCCKHHDKCYESSNCVSYLEYFVPYVWKCYRKKPLCAIDHGEWGNSRSCAARLCACDLLLSRCLQQFTCPRRRVTCKSSNIRDFKNLLFFKKN